VQAVRTCLMFVGEQHGRAREAVDFYVSIFSDGRLDSMETYGPDDEEAEGTVKLSKFSLAGRDFMAMTVAASITSPSPRRCRCSSTATVGTSSTRCIRSSSRVGSSSCHWPSTPSVRGLAGCRTGSASRGS
jgi:uncharacterized glyoxalase superfamily protein PhnB